MISVTSKITHPPNKTQPLLAVKILTADRLPDCRPSRVHLKISSTHSKFALYMVRTYLPSVCPQMPSPANPIVIAASASAALPHSATRFSRALGLSANWVSLYFFIFMESLTAPYYIPFPAASGAIKGRGGSAAEARAVGGGAFNVSSR